MSGGDPHGTVRGVAEAARRTTGAAAEVAKRAAGEAARIARLRVTLPTASISRLVLGERRPLGEAPGTLSTMDGGESTPSRIRVMRYSPDQFEEIENATVEQALATDHGMPMTWIDVDGVRDLELVRRIGEHYGIHPLVQEDILHTHQRPKVEEYPGYIYIVARMIAPGAAAGTLDSEQVSIIILPGVVLLFQEDSPCDVLGAVRDRLRQGKGRARRAGSDYLAYVLVDAIVDNYFVVFERLGEFIESLETRLLEGTDNTIMREIQLVRSDGVLLRRHIWPLREAVSAWGRLEHPLLCKETSNYLRDLYDHTVQAVDLLETMREAIGALMDLHMTSLGNRQNEVMKTLTILSTIFLPLGFLAGLYGMNFEWMPELQFKWGYPILLCTMALVAGGMLIVFRRRGWF